MAPKYIKIQPSLPVTSIHDAITYYTESLGFRLAGRDGNDHCWLQLVDDDSVGKWDAPVNIYLRRRSFAGPQRPPMENDVGFGKVYVRIDGDKDELEKLAATMKTNKAKVVGDVVTKPWGLKDLTVEDHDGNVIVFNQMVEGYQTPAKTVFEPETK